ncbi:gliding motility-associated C-terminal domain-containing protein [Mucilaginibacter ginkgonis]|uniref:Gliding motility-associated C-terminal domain-containing protein n=1 Tax=Mucilaginibacter ginkgonis TaxID=2682091 RepID=A0A7T7JFI6_9SPHI|nr:gliding motility-associated C-terminal domain-containing protein [Mucilaginibacter ginkgonis]QQL48550.1 gliding motility-associated C-terminal domain-containing protein [Mucilaginibacter ginkgonis]
MVDITFGAGAAQISDPFPPGITTLNYAYEGCPNDGDYTITNKMDFCYTNDWHKLVKDHTGDPGGRFMVINADYQPSTFFRQQIDGLCGGTTYEFASWVMNLVTLTERNPDITFSLEKPDGTVLQSFNTGEIMPTATPTWKQYPFYFTMPQGITSVVIRMSNNGLGGQGNDLALDDITFRPAGPGIDVSFKDQPGKEITVCQPASDKVTLVAKTDNCILTNNISFQWQQSIDGGTTWVNVSGATQSTRALSLLGVGTYLYRTLVAGDNNTEIVSCRVISDVLTVHVVPATVSSVSIVSSTTTTCQNTPVTFTATPVNPGPAPVYQWQINGVNAGTNSATFSPGNLADNDKVTCILTGENTCSPPATSNSITIGVISPIKKVTVSSTANTICKNEPVTYVAAVDATTTNLTYSWQINGVSTGNTTPTFTSTSLANNNVVSCTVTATIAACSAPIGITATAPAITVQDPAVITLPVTTYTIDEGSSVKIDAAVNVPGATYSWTPATGLNRAEVLNPIALPLKTTSYTLTVTTPGGCTTISQPVTVQVIKNFIVSPNTFTPNADGVNDTWNVAGLADYPNCTVDIYGRNGRQVFHSIGYSKPWDGLADGQLLPVGTYYYVIDLKNGVKPYAGYVSLL